MFLCAAILGLASISVFAQQVTTDYDHKADFSRVRTFSIYKVQASSPLVEQRLRDDLTRNLTSLGLTSTPEGGDLSITAMGSRGNQKEYNTFYQGLGGSGYGWRGRGFGGFGGGFGSDGVTNTSVINIPVGSVVVDAYNNNRQLLFRGMAKDTLSDKEEKNTKKLEKAIDKIFKEFPVKAAR